jgi:transcriptional regulator with XRE-family HTH domain
MATLFLCSTMQHLTTILGTCMAQPFGAVSAGLQKEHLPTTGDRITAARKMRGLTQTQLADRLDVGRSTIANWERNHAVPEAVALIRLAVLLECNARWLVMMDDSPIPYAKVDPDQAALLEKWGKLTPGGRDKLLEFAAFTLMHDAAPPPAQIPARHKPRNPAKR